MKLRKHKRALVVLLAIVVVVPIAICLTLAIGGTLAGSRQARIYEDRMHDTIAKSLLAADTGQTQVVVTDDALTQAFSSLPSLGGIYPQTIEFSTDFLRGGWLQLYGKTRLWDLSASFEPTVQDGRVQLVIRHFIMGPGAEPPGVSEANLGSALETGINRALEEAGYRATGVTAENGLLTISIEPIPALESAPSLPAGSATPERVVDDRKEAFAHHQRSASARRITRSRRTM